MTPPSVDDTMGSAAEQGVSSALLPQRQKVVLVMDLVESVRLMAANEVAVIDHWRGFVRQATGSVLPRHRGRLVKSLGDGIMAEFDEPREAVAAALTLHRHFDDANTRLPTDQRLYVRAGLNATHVYVDDIDIYGSGVNLAARVAALGGPGETIVTWEVREALADGIDAQVEDLGECYLKHVAGPVRVARIGPPGPGPAPFSRQDYERLQPIIAVIPFESRSTDPERLAIGELLAEGIIAKLSRTPGLRVMARLSASVLRGRELSLPQIGAHTGAHYVVSGSFLLTGGRLRTSVELGSVQEGLVIWSIQRSSELGDLLEPDSALCLEIASAVAEEVVQAEARKVSYRPLPNLESSTLLIGAIALMHRRSAGAIERAQKTLDFLNERMPKQPLGHAWLAKSYVMLAGQGSEVDDAMARKAQASADRAIALDCENSLALAIAGIVSMNLGGDYDRAERFYQQALQADPNNSLAWLYYATLAAFQGDAPRALEMSRQALALSPMDPQKYIYQGIAAAAALAAEDYARTVELASDSIRLNQAHMSAWRLKVIGLALGGQLAQAREAATQFLRLVPDYSVSQFLRRTQSANPQLRTLYADALASAGIPTT